MVCLNSAASGCRLSASHMAGLRLSSNVSLAGWDRCSSLSCLVSSPIMLQGGGPPGLQVTTCPCLVLPKAGHDPNHLRDTRVSCFCLHLLLLSVVSASRPVYIGSPSFAQPFFSCFVADTTSMVSCLVLDLDPHSIRVDAEVMQLHAIRVAPGLRLGLCCVLETSAHSAAAHQLGPVLPQRNPSEALLQLFLRVLQLCLQAVLVCSTRTPSASGTWRHDVWVALRGQLSSKEPSAATCVVAPAS